MPAALPRSRILAALLLLAGAVAVPVTPQAERPKSEKVDGYAEYYFGDLLVVDGQRLRSTSATKFKVKKAPAARALRDIPLGYRVEAKGVRGGDGIIALTSIDAEPNDEALFESDVRKATDELEAAWLQEGAITQRDELGRSKILGRMVTEGPRVDRVSRIMNRLLPPYVARDAVRVHVVDTKEWNAMAMGNGAVWVFTGLLDDMDDDEVAIVLGHELAHYTHEHSRKGFKRAMWGQLIAAGLIAATEQVDSSRARDVLQLAGVFSLLAWQNGYGRDLEDQADRVGLRYAHEGGFDVRRGPGLWRRFQEKYGEPDKVTNFFFANHSRPSARIRNLQRELQLNYRE